MKVKGKIVKMLRIAGTKRCIGSIRKGLLPTQEKRSVKYKKKTILSINYPNVDIITHAVSGKGSVLGVKRPVDHC